MSGSHDFAKLTRTRRQVLTYQISRSVDISGYYKISVLDGCDWRSTIEGFRHA
jgi:hypothetical protein